MGNDLLNQSLVIKLESPDVKTIYPEESIIHWNSCGVRSRRSHTKPLGLNLKNKMNTAEMEDFTDPYEPKSTCSVVIVETENEPLYEGDQSDCENVFGEFMEIEVEQS